MSTGAALQRILIALLLIATGCVAVAPWERGRLAQPEMALEPQPVQRALRSHVYMSREAALAGSLGAGGGCGCY